MKNGSFRKVFVFGLLATAVPFLLALFSVRALERPEEGREVDDSPKSVVSA